MFIRKVKYGDTVYRVGFKEINLVMTAYECHILEKGLFSHKSLYHEVYLEEEFSSLHFMAFETIDLYREKLRDK